MIGLAWALRYADAGLRIFPVNANKKPLTTHGFKDASSDPEVIKAWRRKWAHCEFAWAVPAGMVVVDVDIEARQERLTRLQATAPAAIRMMS